MLKPNFEKADGLGISLLWFWPLSFQIDSIYISGFVSQNLWLFHSLSIGTNHSIVLAFFDIGAPAPFTLEVFSSSHDFCFMFSVFDFQIVKKLLNLNSQNSEKFGFYLFQYFRRKRSVIKSKWLINRLNNNVQFSTAIPKMIFTNRIENNYINV